ncbi:RNA methyltransferase [uncultured Croceitalea sp.]|uniref:TrmH family RNA methyltransferase n=1 Tax=uncultured Croceitalea sp. TaxID=1798908 RepID=UPI0033059754
MVSKNELKLINSLHQKKYRNQHGLFFVEGIKVVAELLQSDFEAYEIYVTKDHLEAFKAFDVREISEHDLKKISALQRSNGVFGVFKIPKTVRPDLKDWIVVLDNIRDPGNLGTIIRLCDWFGIQYLVCSKGTVDCYNPKVLQATMGSIARVNITYQDVTQFLSTCTLPIYGAFMDGETVYHEQLPKAGVLVMGNEANGISSETTSMVKKKISIPQFGPAITESLNVATATAILLNEIRRE